MNNSKLNKKFGLMIGAVCMSISIYQELVYHRFLWLLLAIGILLMLAALALPSILNPVRLLWERVGEFIGMVNTYIILFLVFFLIVTPIGFIMRLLKKSTLDLHPKTDESTYWKPSKTIERNSMEQQF